MIAILFEILFLTTSICSFQFNLWSIITPRNFVTYTLSIFSPLINMENIYSAALQFAQIANHATIAIENIYSRDGLRLGRSNL